MNTEHIELATQTLALITAAVTLWITVQRRAKNHTPPEDDPDGTE